LLWFARGETGLHREVGAREIERFLVILTHTKKRPYAFGACRAKVEIDAGGLGVKLA